MEDLNKILLDFVDGVASEKDQKELFKNLSVDEELQQRMQNLMKVENAVKDRHNSFSPPASSTIRVFDSLGFKPGRVSFQDKIIGFLGRYYQAGLASLITAALFTGGILYFNNNESDTNNSNLFNQINTDPITIVLKEANTSNQRNIADEQSFVPVPVKEEQNSLPFTSQPNQIENTVQGVENNFTPIKISSSNSILYNSSLVSIPRVYNGDISGQISYRDSRSKNDKWSFELNYDPMFSIGQNIQPANINTFNNLGFTVVYDYTNNWDIGLAFKQETYFQRFKGIDQFNREIVYEQNPNFSVIEAFTRVDLQNYLNIPMFLHGGLGVDVANRAGLVHRFKVGMTQDIGPLLYINYGAEYSGLMYSFAGNAYISPNVGLFLGIGLKWNTYYS